MHEHFTTQLEMNLNKCKVFDMLLGDGGESQSGANENR